MLWDKVFRVCESWLHHVPISMTMGGKVTIYWDTPLLKYKMVKFNKPGIVIYNATGKTAQSFDVTVPQGYDVVSTTANNITKYKDMKIEIQKCWNLKKLIWCRFVVLRSACDIVTEYLADISDNSS